jgi:hypothetical protein
MLKGGKMEKDKITEGGKMEKYTTGTGQLVYVHNRADCQGDYCVIHNPSDHIMKDWPTHWRQDRGMMERICEHGVGHPDPDDIDFKRRVAEKYPHKSYDKGVHGCDGCCSNPIAKGAKPK